MIFADSVDRRRQLGCKIHDVLIENFIITGEGSVAIVRLPRLYQIAVDLLRTAIRQCQLNISKKLRMFGFFLCLSRCLCLRLCFFSGFLRCFLLGSLLFLFGFFLGFSRCRSIFLRFDLLFGLHGRIACLDDLAELAGRHTVNHEPANYCRAGNQYCEAHKRSAPAVFFSSLCVPCAGFLFIPVFFLSHSAPLHPIRLSFLFKSHTCRYRLSKMLILLRQRLWCLLIIKPRPC